MNSSVSSARRSWGNWCQTSLRCVADLVRVRTLAIPTASNKVRLELEKLEDRWVPTSYAAGTYNNLTISDNSDFSDNGTYTITGTLTISAGKVLDINSQAKVLIKQAAGVLVNGTLNLNAPTTFEAEDFGNFSSVTTGIVVSGGKLQSTNATLNRANLTNGIDNTRIQVLNGGTLTAIDSTFAWDNVTFENNSTLAANAIKNSAFDGVLAVPSQFVTLLDGGANKRFNDVNLNAGDTIDPVVNLLPLGADTSKQRYVFPGNFKVTSGTTVNVLPAAKVLILQAANLTVNGSFVVNSATSFEIQDIGNFSSATTGIVVSGGSLKASNTVFSRLNSTNGIDLTRINVSNGGTLTAVDSTFAWDQVTFQNDSVLVANDIKTTAFDGILAIPANYVPLLDVGANKRYQDININAGTTIDLVLDLKPLGVDTSKQRYVFPNNFKVLEDTTINVLPAAKVLILQAANLTVNGTLNINSTTSFEAIDAGNFTSATTGIIVDGGTLNASNTTFDRLNLSNGIDNTRIQVLNGGTLTAVDSTFTWDNVTYENTSTLAANAVTNSAFDAILSVPAKFVGLLEAGANKRFLDVYINAGKTIDPVVNLLPLGADASKQRYVFPGNFEVTAGTAVNVLPASKVLILQAANLTVNGLLNVDSAKSFEVQDAGNFTSATSGVVVSAGAFKASNTVFSRFNLSNGIDNSRLFVDAQGTLEAFGCTFNWDSLTLGAGATAFAQYNYLNTTFQVSGAANINPNTIKNNDFSPVSVVAFGTTGTTIDLTNNYWGSSVVSVIQSKIFDKTNNPALPQVLFDPFLANRPVRPAIAPPSNIAFSAQGAQDIPLTVSLLSPSASGLVNVNVGTVTFTVFNSLGQPVGSSVGPINVVNGVATGTYSLPSGTAAGTYTVVATYTGAGNFSNATSTQTFVISPAVVTSTGGSNVNITYSGSGQAINLSSTLSSTAGTINEGTVTYTILNSSSVVVGTPITLNVVNNVVSGSYLLPAGLIGGVYTIQAVYNGTASFNAFTLPNQTLTIAPATTTASASNVTVGYNSTNATVILNANVTSPAGTVNSGTVTVTVRQGVTVIGTPFTATASGPLVINYNLGNNVAAGTYTIEVVYAGNSSFAASSSSTSTLVIDPAVATTVAANASVVVQAGAQTVDLSASITSLSGTITQGTVTFVLLDSGSNVIGTPPAAVTVVNGSASVVYTLPAGTPLGTYTIQVTYTPGTTNITAATTTNGTLTVSAALASISTTSVSTSYSGTSQVLNLSSTITSTSVVNEGSVRFTVRQGVNVIVTSATFAVVNGVGAGTLTLPAGTAGGTYTLEAEYLGTLNFGGDIDASQSLTITPATSTVSVTTASIGYNGASQSVNVSTTITSAAGTVGDGTVTFTIRQGATVIGTPITVNVSSGTASGAYTLPAGLAGGTYTIEASFAASTNFVPATNTVGVLTVTAVATTSVSANATAEYLASGASVALSATVSSLVGSVTAGTVTFTILSGATPIGTPVTATVSNGLASANYSLPANTPVGSYTIRVDFAGTPSFAASTSAAGVLTLTPASTTSTATAVSTVFSSGPQNVQLSASVSSLAGIVNDGTVAFTLLSNGSPVGPAVTGTVTSGSASVSYPVPAALAAGGNYTIRVEYTGAGTFTASSSSTAVLNITSATATVVTTNASVAALPGSQTVSLTANVNSPAGAINEGTLTFTILNGANTVGTAVTVNVLNGVATGTYTLPAAIAVGSYPIVAVYNGTTNVSSFTDSDTRLVVAPAVAVVQASPISVGFSPTGQIVTLTATLSSTSGAVNTGTVTFTVLNGGTVVGTAVNGTVANGTVSVSYALPGQLAAGTYTIRAEYVGNASFSGSTDTTQVLTVTAGISPPTVTPNLVGFPEFAIGAGPGGSGTVTVYNPDKTVAYSATPFASTPGGVRTAVGDFNGDGVTDLVIGTGPGTIARVIVIDGKTQQTLFDIQPFNEFTGGVYVAAGDVNGDGLSDLVIAPDEGGGPRCRVFRGGDFVQLADYFGIEDTAFRGGVRVAIADVTGDGTGDLLVAAGFGGGPRLAVFNGKSLQPGQTPQKPFGDFFVFEPGLRNGVFVTGGDLNGDGFADIIAGAGPGGGPRVYAISGRDMLQANTQVPLSNFFAGDTNLRGGIRVAVKDLDGDNRADLIVGSGTEAGSRVIGYRATTLGQSAPTEALAFDAFAGFANGVFVG